MSKRRALCWYGCVCVCSAVVLVGSHVHSKMYRVVVRMRVPIHFNTCVHSCMYVCVHRNAQYFATCTRSSVRTFEVSAWSGTKISCIMPKVVVDICEVNLATTRESQYKINIF